MNERRLFFTTAPSLSGSLSLAILASEREMRLVRIPAFREAHQGVLTGGGGGGRCDSHQKIFRFMPKVGRGLRNHDENELPAQ